MSLKSRAQDPSGAKTVVMDVTPAIAQNWVSTMLPNRRITIGRVKKLADEMRSGRWELNGESIKIDSGGRLFDGQHRCMAIIESGVTVRCMVFFGALPETLLTIDTGKPRSFADILQMQGEGHAAALSAACRAVYLYDLKKTFVHAGRSPETNPSHRQLLEFLKKNPNLREACAKSCAKGAERILTAGFGAALRYILSRIDAQDAEGFFSRLESGADLKEHDAVLRLRERLLDKSIGKVRMFDYEVAAYVFKSWNLWRKGKPCTLLTVRLGGDAPEPFPVPA